MHFNAVALGLHSNAGNGERRKERMGTASRMGSSIDDTTVPLVICEVCLKRVAKDVARQAEAPHYTAYFCSDQCLERWHAQHGSDPANP